MELAVTLAPLFRKAPLLPYSQGHHFWTSAISPRAISTHLHTCLNLIHLVHFGPIFVTFWSNICHILVQYLVRAISTYSYMPKSDPFWSNMTLKPGRFHDLRLPPSCSSILNRHVLEIYDLLMNSVIAPLRACPLPF